MNVCSVNNLCCLSVLVVRKIKDSSFLFHTKYSIGRITIAILKSICIGMEGGLMRKTSVLEVNSLQ